MQQSIISNIALFFFIASFPTFFLDGIYFWLSPLFFVCALGLALLQTTIDVANFGQKHIEKLDD